MQLVTDEQFIEMHRQQAQGLLDQAKQEQQEELDHIHNKFRALAHQVGVKW